MYQISCGPPGYNQFQYFISDHLTPHCSTQSCCFSEPPHLPSTYYLIRVNFSLLCSPVSWHVIVDILNIFMQIFSPNFPASSVMTAGSRTQSGWLMLISTLLQRCCSPRPAQARHRGTCLHNISMLYLSSQQSVVSSQQSVVSSHTEIFA